MERQECPECGASSVEDEDIQPDDDFISISPPYYPSRHGNITEEGLLNRVIANSDGSKICAEVGKESFVISQDGNPSEQITSLLELIRCLQDPQAGEMGVTDLLQASARR